MTSFIMRELNLTKVEAYTMQKSYFKNHGTTMRGLILHHQTNPSQFLEYVHNIDLSPITRNDEQLNHALKNLSGIKVIFTNGSKNHALNVTRHLGIEHHFDSIFDILDSNYIPKPNKNVYIKMVETLGINPKTSAMIEDLAQNLIPAHELGIKTVWLRSSLDRAIENSKSTHIDYEIDDLTKWINDINYK